MADPYISVQLLHTDSSDWETDIALFTQNLFKLFYVAHNGEENRHVN